MKTITVGGLKFEEYISQQTIQKAVKELGARITHDYRQIKGQLIFLGILNGASIFMSDLVRSVHLQCQLDFLRASSYQGTESTGHIKLAYPIKTSLKGKHLIIVDDILDTGLTLKKLTELFEKEQPASIEICVFCRKADCAKFDVKAKYVGVEIGRDFVVGYGLDYNEKGRNLAAVYRKVSE